jgi:hypothetical protein
MRKHLTILGVISLLVIIGFIYSIQGDQVEVGTQVIKTRTEKDVLSFLNNRKYQVIEFNDKGYFKYKLTEERLMKDPTSKIWSFKKNAESYIGRHIEEHYAVVTNHPLQTIYPDERINLIILKSQGEIIGGISYCEFNTVYNLDGSTIK